MPRRLIAFVLAAFLIGLGVATGDDLPFGGDTLGYLTAASEAVVRATSPRRLASDPVDPKDPSRARFVVYVVKVTEVLKGAPAAGRDLRVAIPQSFDVSRIDDLSDVILFLKKATDKDLRYTNIGSNQDVYFVISGRLGAVPASSADRKDAITSYLRLKPGDVVADGGLLSWTERYVGSTDSFLQRSAVIGLYSQRKRPEAIKQLGNVVNLDSVDPALKRIAIMALQSSNNVAAVSALKEVAENAKQNAEVRQDAVKAVNTLPGGSELVQSWSKTNDPVLGPAARIAIEKGAIK
jgi:hypothetical protein